MKKTKKQKKNKTNNICCLVYMDPESIYMLLNRKTYYYKHSIPYSKCIYTCNRVPIRRLCYIHQGKCKHSALEKLY